MDQVESAKFATKFDLLKGYLQVLLTAMTVVMEFGLRNTFKDVMNQVVANLDGCAAYLAYVGIHSATWC